MNEKQITVGFGIKILSRLRRRPRPWPWMNAKKYLLGGMSLNGHAIPVGGITPPLVLRSKTGGGVIKVPRACPWGCFPFVVLMLFLLSGCVTTAKAPEQRAKKRVLDDVLVFRDLQEVDLDNDGIKDIVAIYSTSLNSSAVKVIKFDKDEGDVLFEQVFNNPPNVKFAVDNNIPTLIVEETVQATGRKLKSIYRWDGKAFTRVGK